MHLPLPRPIWLLVCLLATTHPLADDAPTQDEAIRIQAGRSVVSEPYARAYEAAKGVEAATQGRMVLGMRLAPSRPGVDMHDLRLTLSTDSEDLPLPLEAGTYTVIPVVERLARDNAQFYLNRQSRDVSVHILLLPSQPQAPWTQARVRQTLADAKLALRSVVPWYMRLFISNAGYVGLCSPNPQASVTVQSAGQTVASLPLDTRKTDRLGRPVYCKGFTGKEDYADDHALLLPADGDVVLYQ